MQALRVLQVSHIYREQNRAANTLAKEGAQQQGMGNHIFLEVPPMCIRTHILANISETTFVWMIQSNSSLPQGRGVAHVNSYVQIANPKWRGLTWLFNRYSVLIQKKKKFTRLLNLLFQIAFSLKLTPCKIQSV